MPTAAENYEGRPVIVYSAEQWDARHVLAVASHFGKQTIIQDWMKDTAITDDAIHISNDPELQPITCLIRPNRMPAFVFKLDKIIGQVQTSAQRNAADLPTFLQHQAH